VWRQRAAAAMNADGDRFHAGKGGAVRGAPGLYATGAIT